MEAGSEGEKNKPQEGGETKSKRKMKTAAQLEVLEKTYTVDAYPSEATREELSAKLGLSDRQLQMWFCHRRLKDRKPPPAAKRQRKDSPEFTDAKAATTGGELVAIETGKELDPFGHEVNPRKAVLRHGVAVPRMGSDMLAIRRYNDLPPRLADELRAIAFVEAQLGEPLREDGPILGMEFDPLPPGAFGAPIETPLCHERADAKPVKDSVRTIREYQFLPEQPTVRTDQYERVSPSHHYGLPINAPMARASAVSAGRSFSHGDEHVPYGYGYITRIPNLNLSSHQGKHVHSFPSASGEYDVTHRKNFTDAALEANFGSHPIHAVENPFVSTERRIGNDEDVLQMERKRKSEEARIAREVEAHEKRIRKELEKQDMLRRKREEQIRKEMERQDRERRKEEERLLREKQREQQRCLKEQKREILRREKFLLKESIRAEKMRQKEEMRREKEAARLRAANERAIARKIAKEWMELIDDERLELMELAASSKGLLSMLSLDFETLQNLDVYRDKLAIFPPKTVKLKRPFTFKPWNGSEENIGNLLMVWRFLITFADVLGVWPFTLDEFAQALHDFDPRLLGEVHVSLLRTIIKDIEDVARTASIGLGANQNTAANPGGGHPHVVEGAYTWGFDICSWQRHLNSLTWPEVLRQFALSAGFGPQLKERNIEQAYLHDDNEANNSENIISNLRNGVAAENAFSVMQERGFSNPRRSRHRLTPGTVKFAAFHVLSFEGEEGLTILEVAEKIQKSGLRDLTTSKTPEASIAAALSRDTKLFDRVAPSTYCVRAPYRKDPADADAILAEARERIRMFKSGTTDDVDDADRDEDSESDVADDPDIDDLGTELNPKSETLGAQETENSTNVESLLENGDGSAEVIKAPQSDLLSTRSGCVKEEKYNDAFADQPLDVSAVKEGGSYVDHEDACIDESQPGEPWLQGLIEGEYSDLSVEERLSALVALVGVVVEGNTIRAVLEERLEAANALKKQMWADVQLDKRRIKEESVMRTNYSSCPGNKLEHNLMIASSDDRRSPMATVGKINETLIEPVLPQKQLSDAQKDQNYINNIQSEGNLQMQDMAVGPDNFQYQQQGYAVDRERLRAQLKSYVGCKAEELYVYRSLPLGQDRRRNRYWRFTASASPNDPGCGRIFVELCDGQWRLIDSQEGFDALLTSLDVRGVRESHLHFMLQKIEMSFKKAVRRNAFHATTKHEDRAKAEAVEVRPSSLGSPSSSIFGSDSDMSDSSTTFKIELGNNVTEKNGALKRYQDFEKWMWGSLFNSAMLCAFRYGEKKSKQLLCICDFCHDVYYSEDTRCPSCLKMTCPDKSDLDFSKQLTQLEVDSDFVMCGSVSSPLRIRLLKIQLALVGASLPLEALQPFWTESYRRSWGLKLLFSTSAEELLQVLTMLENAVKRDFLSSKFETTIELLGLSNQTGVPAIDRSVPSGSVTVLPWIPKTTAAVALRLFELDNSIAYTPNQKVEPQKDKISLENDVRNAQDDETTKTPLRAGYTQEANWTESGLGFSSTRRGRPRGRGRPSSQGGKSELKVTGSKSRSGKRATTSTNSDGLEKVLKLKGQPRAPSGSKRGRRSTRSRKRPTNAAFDISGNEEKPEEVASEHPVVKDDDWNQNDVLELRVGCEEDASSSGRSSHYNEEDGQAVEDDYDDMVMADEYAGGSNGVPGKLMDGSDYNMNSDDEDDYDGDARDVGGYGAGYLQQDMNAEDYIKEYSDSEEPRNDYELNNVTKSFAYEDPDLTSSSSGFSE